MVEASTGPKPDKQAQDILNVLNQARTSPQTLVQPLQDLLKKFEGNILKMPEDQPDLKTHEGPKAVEEAINYLKTAKPVGQLVWNPRLALVAKAHCDDTGPKGSFMHESSKGESVKDRFKKQGKIIAKFGENLSYGCEKAQDIVLQLIVDDGVQTRGHRTNIFDPAFKQVGLHFAAHKNSKHMACIDFAVGFVDPN